MTRIFCCSVKISGIKGFLRWTIDYVDSISTPYFKPVNLSRTYSRLGMNDKAYKWLEVLYETRYPTLRYIKVDQSYDSIRADPRYADLLRRLNLADGL